MTENNPLYSLLVIGIMFLGVVMVPTALTTVQQSKPVQVVEWGFNCGFSVDACAFFSCWLESTGQSVACPGGGMGYKRI